MGNKMRTMLKWVTRALFIIVAVTGVVLMFWLPWRGSQAICPGWSQLDLAQVAQRTQIDFPENAELVGALRYRCFLPDEMWATVRVDKKDFEKVLNYLPSANNEYDTPEDFNAACDPMSRPISLKKTPEWWMPGSPTQFVVRGWVSRLYVLVDLDDEARAVLYIYHSYN